jgi:hypothetical protein
MALCQTIDLRKPAPGACKKANAFAVLILRLAAPQPGFCRGEIDGFARSSGTLKTKSLLTFLCVTAFFPDSARCRIPNQGSRMTIRSREYLE